MTEKEKAARWADDAERILTQSGHDVSARYPFRLRSAHSRRVMKWAERLLENHPEADREVLLCAAAFHDTGYSGEERLDHETQSALIWDRYARENSIDPVFARKVRGCIAIHSEKHRMREPENLTPEQLLLMEADLLDEEGAMGICWDGLSCGVLNTLTYRASYERTAGHTEEKRHNPMVHDDARRLWDEKAVFVEKYVSELEKDLEEYR